MAAPTHLATNGLLSQPEPQHVVRQDFGHDGQRGQTTETDAPDSGHFQPSVARRILVVDDNRDLAISLAIIFRLWGHEVCVAHDGQTGLAIAQEFVPDVIFLDIGLPRLSGYEVAQRLRQCPVVQRARLVAISGYGCEDTRQRSLDAGFDLHLTKPVDPLDLQPLLAR